MGPVRSVIVGFALLLTLAPPAHADEVTFSVVETLAPNTYTVRPGGAFTLFGYFTVTGPSSEPSLFPYDREFLFGLQPDSPHLNTTAGALVSSRDFGPPVEASFEDVFSGPGYLGPAALPGSGTTAITALRTFAVPSDTPFGTYRYSYGINFLLPPEPGSTLRVMFDRSLTLNVSPVPEPGTMLLLATGLFAACVAWRRVGATR